MKSKWAEWLQNNGPMVKFLVGHIPWTVHCFRSKNRNKVKVVVKKKESIIFCQKPQRNVKYFWHNRKKYLKDRMKILLLYKGQIIHWITSSIHENSKLKPGENMLCTEIVSDIQNNFCTQHVLPMFSKKKSFWQRFTCMKNNKTWRVRKSP